MGKGIYSSSEASKHTIVNFANKLNTNNKFLAYKIPSSLLLEKMSLLGDGDIDLFGVFNILKNIADISTSEIDSATSDVALHSRIRRVALALSYAEEKEEDFASKKDLEWIPRIKEGLTSYGLESIEYQITEDASSFQEAWIFPGKPIENVELGKLLIGVDYSLEPRTAKPIPDNKVALSVFFEKIVADSRGTASKHILPLYLIVVNNTKWAVIVGLVRLRLRVGFGNIENKLYTRFQHIKNTKA